VTDRPNIVLVTVDSLRADHCGFMGYEKDTTPTLDAMAEEGVVFENAVAPGTSTPDSMPVMFTGMYPIGREIQHEGTIETSIGTHMAVRESLPERLSRMGYTTAAFTPNPWISRYFGFDDGFDHFVDFLDEDRGSWLFKRMLEGRGTRRAEMLRLFLSWIQEENSFKPWGSFYDEIIQWGQSATEPYFLWVFLLDSHFPYLTDREHRSQSLWGMYHSNLQLYVDEQTTPYGERTYERLVQGYDDAVRYTDKFFSELRADLDDPVFVITSDHGEGFGDHGTYGHQERLYEENVHVPLVVSGEGYDGSVSDPISLATLPDIITDIASGEDDIGEPEGPYAVVSPQKEVSAIRLQGWKLIRDDRDDKTELYHLDADPEERENLADEETTMRYLLENALVLARQRTGANQELSDAAAALVQEAQL